MKKKYEQRERRRLLQRRIGIINSPLTDCLEIIGQLRKPALRKAAFRRLLEFEDLIGTKMLFHIFERYKDLYPVLSELLQEMGITISTFQEIDPNPELFGPATDAPRVDKLWLVNTRVSTTYVLAQVRKKDKGSKAIPPKKGLKKKKP